MGKFFPMRTKGKENLPKHPFIIAADHKSWLDPPAIGTVIRKPMVYLSKESLFKYGFSRFILKRLGVIPVVKMNGTPFALRRLLSFLKEGRSVVLFPEGTRSYDGSLGQGLPGVGFLVAKSRVPVVPVYLKGTEKALPRDGKMIRPRPVTIYFGRPLDFRGEGKDYRKIALLVTEKIGELKKEVECIRFTTKAQRHREKTEQIYGFKTLKDSVNFESL